MLVRSVVIGALVLAGAGLRPAAAAELIPPEPKAERAVAPGPIPEPDDRAFNASIPLPPERHQIEVAIHPPGGRQFIINGRIFTAHGDACLGWEAGDQISWQGGDNWTGWCQSVVIYNHTLRRTCEMACGYF